MTKLHILSDLHLEFADYKPTVTDADIVVLAGDIHKGTLGLKWAREKFHNSKIIYVSGNHEFYHCYHKGLLEDFHEEADQYGIHFLENNEVILDGIRFLGCTLWTDYTTSNNLSQTEAMKQLNTRIADHQLILKRFDVPNGWTIEMVKEKRNREMLDLLLEHNHYADYVFEPFTTRDAWTIHKNSTSWLTNKLFDEQFDGKTVVVTHHGPSIECKHKFYGHTELSGAFYSDLSNLIEKADLWIYGHTHSNLDIKIKNTRLISNQRGYPSEKNTALDDFNEDLIVEI